MKTDIELHRDVLAELTWDPKITEKEIAISAKGGVVTLSGSVTSYAEKIAAELAVERVAGVAAIANDLVVDPAGASPRPDTDIAHRIVEALAWDIEVPHHGITAKVTNGWVTLEGEVEWQYQRDAAARTVRYLAGVRGITNALLVHPRVKAGDVSASIRDALARRAGRTAAHVTVTTLDGVVTLTGTVGSFGDRRAAEGAAWAAPGVSEVRDQLAVVF